MIAKYGPIINVMEAIGYLLVFLFNLGLPSGEFIIYEEDDSENMEIY